MFLSRKKLGSFRRNIYGGSFSPPKGQSCAILSQLCCSPQRRCLERVWVDYDSLSYSQDQRTCPHYTAIGKRCPVEISITDSPPVILLLVRHSTKGDGGSSSKPPRAARRLTASRVKRSGV